MMPNEPMPGTKKHKIVLTINSKKKGVSSNETPFFTPAHRLIFWAV